ncbi:AP2 domain-containing protein [Clostridium subterminale]|uniref:AP2 domain-containing protein n=1 Tax=Clostridium subterminale TaxID=1550 RepID=A0ABN1KRV7_CLOSU
MFKLKDLTGQKFGRLIVIKAIGKTGKGNYIWECKCKCGNIVNIVSTHLVQGNTRSCGCLKTETSNTSGNNDRFKGTKIRNLNTTLPKHNTSGYKGVSWEESRGKYRAYIILRGKGKFLGYFSKIEDAIQARKEAEEKYFKPIIEEFETLKERTSYGSEIKQKPICEHGM